jgi:hypothetical protein
MSAGVAPRSKKVAEYQNPASTVSIRKKRRPGRAETPHDAIEPFPPGGIDPNFDDIEPEPELEPQEPSIPPLVQARMLRASPNIQDVERPVEVALDPHQQCYKALLELRARVR